MIPLSVTSFSFDVFEFGPGKLGAGALGGGGGHWFRGPCTEHSRTQLSANASAQVMMFGMTGAGKSALGNLIAGSQIFDSGAAGSAGLLVACMCSASFR